MDSRARFEAWVKQSGHVYNASSCNALAYDGDGYFNVTLQLMLEAWQACEASRESVFLEGYRIPFDYKTASDLVCSDIPDNVRKFVSDAKWTNEECNGNRNTIADLRKEIQRRDAEIDMLKTALLDAEAREFIVELPDRAGGKLLTEQEAHYANCMLDECIDAIEKAGGRVK